MRSTTALIVTSLMALAAGMGCASSTPEPNDPWAAAQTNVGRAQAGGAPNVPDANLHLQFALEDLQKCKQLIGEDNERATSLCQLSSSEAELALGIARQVAAQKDALEAQAELQQARSNRQAPLPSR